jgi:hypothetical protein
MQLKREQKRRFSNNFPTITILTKLTYRQTTKRKAAKLWTNVASRQLKVLNFRGHEVAIDGATTHDARINRKKKGRATILLMTIRELPNGEYKTPAQQQAHTPGHPIKTSSSLKKWCVGASQS